VPESNTDSVFQKTEAWLSKGKHRKAIKVFINNNKCPVLKGYRSTMDYIHVSLFPHWKEPCFKFYNDEGPQLREMTSAALIEKMDQHMLNVLKVCWAIEKSQQEAEWAEIATASCVIGEVL